MSGATRYTTESDAADLLSSTVGMVALQPGSLVGLAVFLALRSLHAATEAAVVAGVTVAVIGVAVALYRNHFGPVARLRQAMIDMGLCFRHEDGTLQGPRVRGRVRRVGRNRRVTWAMPPGIALSHVLDRREAVELHTNSEVVAWAEDGYVVTEMLRHRIPERIAFSDFYRPPFPAVKLGFGLGCGRRGKLWVSVADAPHVLVGGATGGGKSMFLLQALTWLALTYSPDRLRLLLIDLKGGVELHRYAELPHSLGTVVDSVESAAAVLTDIRALLDARLAELRRADVRDIDAWNSDPSRPHWYRLLVVVDEVAELTDRRLPKGPLANAAAEAAGRLTELARLGRAPGIHLLLSTQRPDVEAVPGNLKANIPVTVSFRTRGAVNSRILLDGDERAALLPPHPGRAILLASEGMAEFQAVYVDAEQSRRLLAQRWGDPAGAHPPSLTEGVLDTPQSQDDHR
jgi:hypothetical protein